MTQQLTAHPLHPSRRSFDRARAMLLRPPARYAIYGAIALALYAAAVAARGVQAWQSDEPLNFIVSDARGKYVYLPSLVLDWDVDLRNQMLGSFGEELDRIDYDIHRLTPTGVVANKYSLGMALTLAPAFVVAHGVALAGHALGGGAAFAPDGYSPPYQLVCLAMTLALAACTMILLDRVMERHLRLNGVAVAGGVILFWLGSHYAWYCLREPFMVHVISTFWVTGVVYLGARVRFGAAGAKLFTSLPALALATSMAMVARPTNVFVIPFLIWCIAAVVRGGQAGRLLRALPLALVAGILPLFAQAAVWRAMYGSWLHYSYGGERFVWTDPALFQTLFGLHKGLFVWTPLLVPAVLGLILAFRRGTEGARRELAACWIIGAVILWYLNSAWWAWGFGWSFGARAFLELAGMFVLGLALAVEWLRERRPAVHQLALVLLFALVGYNYVLMALYQTHRINRGDWEKGGWNPAGASPMFLEHVEAQRRAKTGSTDR